MNDRFKFRGMTLGGEWVYGNLAIINKKIKPYRITIDEGYYISNTVGMPFAYPVRPETIGQCTGLKDKNGNLIYEGDIVKFGASGLLRGVVKFGEYENCIPCGDDNVYCSCVGWYLDDGCDTYPLNDTQLEITGNIH